MPVASMRTRAVPGVADGVGTVSRAMGLSKEERTRARWVDMFFDDAVL